MTKVKIKSPSWMFEYKKIIFAILAVIMIAFCAWFAKTRVFAAETHSISDVGSITDLKAFDSSDNEFPSSASPLLFAYVSQIRVQISGKIDDISSIATGDKVEIYIKNAPGSTYRPSIAQGNFGTAIYDGSGTKVFDVSVVSDANPTDTSNQAGSHFYLTRTSESSAGELNFSINTTKGVSSARVMTGITSSNVSSTWEIEGTSKNVVIPNTAKDQTKTDYLTATVGITGGSYVDLNTRIYLHKIYNTMIELIDQGKNDDEIKASLVATYGSVLTNDYIQVKTLQPNDNYLDLDQLNLYTFCHDIDDTGSHLISFYNDCSVSRSSQLTNTNSLNADMTFNQIVSQMNTAGAGTFSKVENSDGTITIARNLGPLLTGVSNSDLTYSNNALTLFPSMPNTALLNNKSKSIAETAKRIGLSGADLYFRDRIELVDKEIPTTVDICFQDTLFLTSDTCRSVTVTPATNQSAGQTTIKLNHRNLLNGGAVDTTDSYYGWPAGNPAGEPETPAQSLSKKTVAGYVIVTDSNILSQYSLQNYSVAHGNILSATSTKSFPASGADTYQFVYAPIFKLEFESNGGSNVNTQNITQTGIPGSSLSPITGSKPTDSTREGYDFKGWYTDDETFANEFDFSEGVYKNVKVFAKWEKKSYQVDFKDPEGNIISSDNVDHGDSATAPTPPDIPHWEFVEWDKEYDNITGDLIVTAIYKELPRCQYDSNIYADDENCIKPQTPEIEAPNTGAKKERLSEIFFFKFSL